MRKCICLWSLLLLAGIQMSIAQTRTIRGLVTDRNDGVSLAGVTVLIKNTTTGTSTDTQGEYAIQAKSTDILVFSFIGMKTQEIAVGDRSVIDVAMESDARTLEEVVVTGYGVTRKQAFTGAATTVGSDEIMQITDPNPIKTLDGTVPGLQMSVSSGQPGAPAVIYIRGRNSINSGTQPLYVIDGVPISATTAGMRAETEDQAISPLSTLNAADIESITILKDATATSIYGARAANGVIVITTKKGQAGKLKLNLTGRWGMEMMSSIPKKYRALNADQYTELMTEGMLNNYNIFGDDGDIAFFNDIYFGNTLPYTTEGMTEMLYAFLGIDTPYNTNWMDEVTQVGFIEEYNLDLQGGGATEGAPKFYASFGYFRNDAFVKSKDLERYSGRFNFSQSPGKLFDYGFMLNLSYTEMNLGAGGGFFSDPITEAQVQSPLQPVKNPDGSWNFNTVDGYNPVAQRSKYGDKNQAKQYRATITPYVAIHFRDDLTFTSRMGIDYYGLTEFGFMSLLSPQGVDVNGSGEQGTDTRTLLSITNTLNYIKSYQDRHNLNLLLGQEAQKTKEDISYLAASNYATPRLNRITTASSPNSASTQTLGVAMASFFFNGQYDYMSKYYFSASVRADGSSRFGKHKRWAAFGSIGARYRISSEDFMQSTSSWLDNLTFRASYGTSGNQDVGDRTVLNGWYASRDLFGYGYNYNGEPGSAHTQQGNPDLKWEHTNKFNVGVDMAFLTSRLTLEFDYYYHRTKNMVFMVPVSRTTGLINMPQNVGKLQNQGIEFTINANVLRLPDFNWDLTLIGSHNQNKVIKLSTGNPIEGTVTIIEKGRPINTFKMPQWAGVDPDTGNPLWYKGTEGKEITFDYNEAGKRYLGSADPKFIGSLSSRFTYKSFDFSFMLNATLGGKIYGSSLTYDEQTGESGFTNTTRYVYDNRWQNPGDQTDVPRFIFANPSGGPNPSSRFLMDGRNLKIKSLTLGYTFPQHIIERARMSSARVFVTADNIYTFHAGNYRGFDPSSADISGFQFWNYPTPRNVVFGLTIGF